MWQVQKEKAKALLIVRELTLNDLLYEFRPPSLCETEKLLTGTISLSTNKQIIVQVCFLSSLMSTNLNE